MKGKTLLHFEILESIGSGGMGEVYRARDTRLSRDVALKFLPPQSTRDDVLLARFRREARILASLSHPNIAAIYGFEEADSHRFLVMELVEGQELGEWMHDRELSPEEIQRVIEEVAQGLQFAHDQGVVHRDLKPGNIMVTADGHIKILDFGLARAYQQAPTASAVDETVELSITQNNVVLGTPAYMSPEQATGSPSIDHRSDIYSLGCILFEMATGGPPYTGPSSQSVLAQHATAPVPPLKGPRDDLSGPLEAVVQRSLAKSPEDRQQTAMEFSVAVRSCLFPDTRSRGSRRWVAVIAAMTLVVLSTTLLWINHRARERAWIHEVGLPGILSATEQAEWPEAMALAARIRAIDPENPKLAELEDTFSRTVEIRTQPEGAEVWMKPFKGDGELEWTLVGLTPVTARVANGFQRVRFEKPEYDTTEIVSHWYYLRDQTTLLCRLGESPPGMLSIPGGDVTLNIPGLDHLAQVHLKNYFIDKYEVTNEEYARFVKAGSYTKPEAWPAKFVDNGTELTFSEAMARFVDSTGQPGPATWVAGDYPEGHDRYPVSGVSWYEAVAYAAFVDRELPTVYHWNRAAETRVSHVVVPFSNFDGKGTAPVGEYPGMTCFGARDMAGNVREWCSTATSAGERVILGGGWNDLTYMFNDFFAQEPWDRSVTNGFRTVLYSEGHSAEADKILEPPYRDFLAERPVSDEVFGAYRNLFRYDRGDLKAQIVKSYPASDGFQVEKVEFDAAYGGERMQAYFYRPTEGVPPFPAVVYFPGSNAIHEKNSDALSKPWFRFLMKRGYCVIHPILKGTYERGDDLASDYPDESQFYLDHLIAWGKDVSRSIDYLESRSEVDSQRLAYFGVSWGGYLGNIMLAIEPRFRAGVLYVAGLVFQRSRPEADALNYVTRVTVPVIMMNGKYDHFFPVESSQIPMYKLLGTPPEHKKHYLYETGHSVPRKEVIRESLGWLDRYLKEGP